MKKKRLITGILVFSTAILLALGGGWAYSAYLSEDRTVSAAGILGDTGSSSPSDGTVGGQAGRFTDSLTDGFFAVSNNLDLVVPTEPPFREYDVSLMMVGDNLMHMGIVHTGMRSDGTRNYDFLFENIRAFLEAADIKIINQETIFGGNERGFSGFPYFNSPTEVGDAIAQAGFNVVLHASNHAADQGKGGLLHCIEFWKTHPEVLMVGIQEDPNAEPDIPLIEAEGITFAVLNYTYGPNMATLPSDMVGRLNMLCDWDKNSRAIDFTSLNPQVLADIAQAKELADIVVVCPHWGTEYMTKPSSYQRDFADQMAEAGADLIIGTHPHVTQPVEWITTQSGRRVLCFYSLGNYVSTQQDGISMLEAMAWVTFHVDKNGVTIDEDHTGAIPLVCQYKSGPLRLENVYLLEEYTQELASAHGIRSWGGVNLTLSDLQKWSGEIFGDMALDAAAALEK